jgi:hypothetical protein
VAEQNPLKADRRPRTCLRRQAGGRVRGCGRSRSDHLSVACPAWRAASVGRGVAAGRAKSCAGAMRAVQYHGYEINAPASWLVYNLAADRRGVLLNSHAMAVGWTLVSGPGVSRCG